MDKFQVSLKEIAELTDYQIKKIYFHKRDKHGCIKFPELEMEVISLKDEIEESLMHLEGMSGLMKQQDYEAAREKLLAKRKVA